MSEFALGSNRAGVRLEAHSDDGECVKWRVRRTAGWRRFLPIRWTTGTMAEFGVVHALFVRGQFP